MDMYKMKGSRHTLIQKQTTYIYIRVQELNKTFQKVSFQLDESKGPNKDIRNQQEQNKADKKL